MNALLWCIFGYVIHDAVQPTIIGQTLDKISLPSDLFVSTSDNEKGAS